MDFDSLNTIARGSQRNLKKISELELNHPYLIERVLKVTTKYGPKVTADLEGNVFCYLPCRVSKELLDNDEKQLKAFQEGLISHIVTVQRIEGRWNPIRFNRVERNLVDVNGENL